MGVSGKLAMPFQVCKVLLLISKCPSDTSNFTSPLYIFLSGPVWKEYFLVKFWYLNYILKFYQEMSFFQGNSRFVSPVVVLVLSPEMHWDGTPI